MRAVTENKNSRHFSNLLAKPDIFELCLAFLPDDMLEIVFSTLIHAKIFTIPRPLSTAAESDRGTVMIHPQLTIAIVKRNSLNTFVRLPRVTLELIQQPDLDASTRLHLMLNNTDPNDRYLSSLIKQLIPTLLAKLNDEYSDRAAACNTLVTILVTTQLSPEIRNRIIPALLKKLDDWNSNMRAAACNALATLQLPPEFHNQIISALLKKLDDRASDVRAAACNALTTFQLSPEFHNQIIPTLLEKLNAWNSNMRAAACNALATLQLPPEFHNQIIPTLLEKLNDESFYVRTEACNALATLQLSPEFHNQIISTLLEKLNAWNSDVRAAACNALATLQLSPEFHNQIIPTLLEKLNDESFYVRTEACKALATLDITGHLSTEKIENIATNLLELAHSNNHDIGNQALSVLLLLMTHHPRLLEDKKIASSNNAIKLKIAAHAMQYAIPSLPMLSLSKNPFLKATAAYKTSHDAKVKKINSITTELNTALEKYFKESGQRTPALQQNIKTLFEELIVIVCLEKNRLTVPFFQTKKSHSITTHSAKQLINYFKLPQSIHMRNALADIFSFQSRVDGASQTVNWRDTTQFNAALTQLMNQTLATRTSQSENILASVASVTPS